MKMFKKYPDIVSVEDIMRMLNMGRSSVYELLRSNSIRSVKAGKKYIVPKQAVIDFVCGVCYNDTG